jgi:hypothetical protein
MLLFDEMSAENLKNARDVVTFMNGVRAAGFCRPWEQSIKILRDAFYYLPPDEVYPVINTMLTNLKYTEASTTQSKVNLLSRAKDVIDVMRSEGLPMSTAIAVS